MDVRGTCAQQTLVRRRPSWWWREPRYAHPHRFTPRFKPRFKPRFATNGLPTLATQRAAGSHKRRQPAPTPPPPTPPPTPPPVPFLPDRIGKRPRRERPPAVPLVPADEVRMCSRMPCALSRVPPAGTPGLSPKRGQLELLGQRYGPRNTCSVDTMLTLAQACRTHPLTHPLTRPLTHPLTRSPAHSLTHPLIHPPPIHACLCSLRSPMRRSRHSSKGGEATRPARRWTRVVPRRWVRVVPRGARCSRRRAATRAATHAPSGSGTRTCAPSTVAPRAAAAAAAAARRGVLSAAAAAAARSVGRATACAAAGARASSRGC